MTPRRLLFLLPLLTLQCGDHNALSSDALVTTKSPLFAQTPLWRSQIIPVCFPPNGSPTVCGRVLGVQKQGDNFTCQTATDQEKILTKEIISDTWGRAADLTFTGWDTCSDTVPANHPNTIAVEICCRQSLTGPNSNGWSPVGLEPFEPSSGKTRRDVRYVTVHEFGHALGFGHDEDRSDNWSNGHPLVCKVGHGPIPGTFFGPLDNNSVMSDCGPIVGHLSGIDVFGVKTAYPFTTRPPIASDLPAYNDDVRGLNCQYLTDVYGGIELLPLTVTGGYEPANVTKLWEDLNCEGVVSQFDLKAKCQTISDLYGVVAGFDFVYAPEKVKKWWRSHNCGTDPLITEDPCQRASDTFGIVARQTFATAPSDVQTWWKDPKNHCDTVPRNPDACQHFSDFYGAVGEGDLGWAPTDAQNWYTTHGCMTTPITGSANRCQQLSDLFALSPTDAVSFAPAEAQSWWTANHCKTAPQSDNACQKAADLYYVNGGFDFGAAPDNVQTWWRGHIDPGMSATCNNRSRARPTNSPSARACFDASSRFGIVDSLSFGFAPQSFQDWWSASNCHGLIEAVDIFKRTPFGPQPLPG